MTTTELTPRRPRTGAGGDGFAQLLRSEWTKFRTVRGWIIGLILAALFTVLFGVLAAVGGSIDCSNSPTGPTLSGAACRVVPPLGPNGEPVSDSYYFVHRSLTGDGSITARVTSLTGRYSADGHAQVGAGTAGMTPGTQPWSKAGLVIEQDATRQGSPYALMTATGGNGVRMQYDYIHDTAGERGAVSAASPQWLRLTRSGDTITGYDSADGVHWTEVATATLDGLPSTVQAGMFAASPDYAVSSASFGGGSISSGPSQATGTFDDVSLQGAWAGGTWTGTPVAQPQAQPLNAWSEQPGGTFTVTGSGDIAPAGGEQTGRPVEQSLVGAFAGLIAIIVVAVLFITTEYRRGLIHLTLAASPRRGRVLAAKAVVVGVAGFVVGLVACAVSLPLCDHLAYSHGSYLLPTTTLTEVRVVVGTAGIFAVVAVLALAVGTLLRRSAVAVTLVIVGIVLSYILVVASVLPDGVAEWLTRLTPAAAFSVQQTQVAYPQLNGASYTPSNGYFPLAPWAGFAVLCGYAALALALAAHRLRKRDA